MASPLPPRLWPPLSPLVALIDATYAHASTEPFCHAVLVDYRSLQPELVDGTRRRSLQPEQEPAEMSEETADTRGNRRYENHRWEPARAQRQGRPAQGQRSAPDLAGTPSVSQGSGQASPHITHPPIREETTDMRFTDENQPERKGRAAQRKGRGLNRTWQGRRAQTGFRAGLTTYQ